MRYTLKTQQIEATDQPKISEQHETPNGNIKTVQIEDPEKQVELKTLKNHCAEIKKYSSLSQISEKIDQQIATTKVILGEYLRQLDNIRHLVIETSGKKRKPAYLNGFEIVVDAMPTNELIAMESVVRSYSQHLTTLKSIKESLNQLCQLQDVEGITYFVLEKEGIPERIILRKLKN
jgi:hypothetical protein